MKLSIIAAVLFGSLTSTEAFSPSGSQSKMLADLKDMRMTAGAASPERNYVDGEVSRLQDNVMSVDISLPRDGPCTVFVLNLRRVVNAEQELYHSFSRRSFWNP